VAAVRNRPRADAAVTIRIAVQTRELIDKAATSIGESRNEFMIESARRRAVDVLLDHRIFNLDPKTSSAFMRALDDPPASSEQLHRLMNERDPWA
jgi:uncharacterized protein (DUF1778 family)